MTLDLQGPHDHLLDDQVRYRGSGNVTNLTGGGSGSSNGISSNGTITSVSGQSNDDVRATVDISFANLCQRGGVPFIGEDVTIRIDKERDLRDSTTIGNELGRARAVEAYTYFSNPNGLEFRPWFTPTIHNLSRKDILNGADADQVTPYTIDYNTLGNKWGTTPLAQDCLLYTSPSPRDGLLSRMPSSA